MTLTLAPLAGYTDKAFREVARSMGADAAVTEMVSAEGLARGGDKTMMVWLNDSPEHCSELEASSLMSLIMDVNSSSGSGGLLEESLVDVGTDIHGDGTSVGWMSDKSGKEQYIDLFFRHPVMMSSLGVYWSVSDGAALPDSWKVMFLSDTHFTIEDERGKSYYQ